jgi:hypothetical protein
MNAKQPAAGRSGPGRAGQGRAPRGELSVPATVAPGLPPAGSFAELELPAVPNRSAPSRWSWCRRGNSRSR